MYIDFPLKKNESGYLSVGVRELYRYYKKDPRKKNQVVPYKIFKKIIATINERVWYEMVVNLYRFKPPHNFGSFFVIQRSCDTCDKHIDWQKTREKGEHVYVYNLHTMGRSFDIKWDKTLCKLKGREFYLFDPYRGYPKKYTGTRGLAAWIKKCSRDPTLLDYSAHLI